MKNFYYLILLVATCVNAQGSLCTDPIVINALPYTTSDNTANYADTYDPQTTTHPVCSTTQYGNYYHSGNDVIYAYTPSENGAIKAEIPAALAWTGMFIYTNCADIGVSYAACATGPGAGIRTIDNFAVTAGTTYYIYISSWASPQTVTYTLNVTNLTMASNEVTQNTAIKLYPNPVTDNLFIESDFSFKHAVIYNVNGQRLEVKMSNNEIQANHLQSGFYILELLTDDGVQIRKNFIKSSK
jgi:hypothetical protein